VSELVTLVDDYLATLRLSVNGDDDAKQRLFQERDQFIDTTGRLLSQLDPAERAR
jgi:hypothetical protein